MEDIVERMNFEELVRTMGSMKDDYLTYTSIKEDEYRLAYVVGTNVMFKFQKYYNIDKRIPGMRALVDGIPLYWGVHMDKDGYNVMPEDTVFDMNEKDSNVYRRILWE